MRAAPAIFFLIDMSIYSTSLRNFLLPLGDLYLGTSFIKKLKFLEKSQWWSSGRLKNFQNRRLQLLVNHAYKNVPYYKSKFEKCILHHDAKLVLRKINESGVTQSILSAGKQSSLVKWVEHHMIEYIFSQLIGVENEKADGKVEAGVNWLKNSHFSSEHILLIGDTIHDGEVSKALGVDCLLVNIGHVSTQRLEKTGYRVLPSLKRILEFLTIN